MLTSLILLWQLALYPEVKTYLLAPDPGLWFQVEAPMIVVRDSAEWYVTSAADNSGRAIYTAWTGASSRSWRLICHVVSLDAGHDSFFFALDGGPEEYFGTSNGAYGSQWQWVEIDHPLVLSPGPHNFRFRGREAGTRLGEIYLTNDTTFTPP